MKKLACALAVLGTVTCAFVVPTATVLRAQAPAAQAGARAERTVWYFYRVK